MEIKEATQLDIEVLAAHHKMMFNEIFGMGGNSLCENTLLELEEAYKRKIIQQIPEGICKAWVVSKKGKVVASGAITLISLVPIPFDLNHCVAYLHSVYTEKEYRGRHFARSIIETAIEYCKKNGVNRIILNASEAGRRIYKDIGFLPSNQAMILLLER